MAILSKEEYINAVHARIGTATDDDSIIFTENMLDTFNDLERRANANTSAEMEQRLKDLDESWRKRYTHRFMTGCDSMNPNGNEREEEIRSKAETIKIEDLFESK